jgi:hypothetical protein
VTNVKSLSDVERVLRSITDAADADVVRQLKCIDAQLKRLLGDDDSEDDEEQEVEQLAALKQLATVLKSFIQ